MSDEIRFYSVADEFGDFSNFAQFPVRVDGDVWPTSEHYFQACKFKEPNIRRKIRRAKSPMIAARMGRDRARPLRRDWESIKVDVMRKAVRAKFTQHEELRELLLSTGEAKIVEHTQNDAYWGDGGDGSGKNMLGRVLMEVREEIRSDPAWGRPYERAPRAISSADRWYRTLELEPGASASEVVQAYRVLSEKYDPDRFVGDPEKAEAARQVHRRLTEARDALLKNVE